MYRKFSDFPLKTVIVHEFWTKFWFVSPTWQVIFTDYYLFKIDLELNEAPEAATGGVL